MADLKTVADLLCQRYNVAALDGKLADLIEAGDVEAMREDFAVRELYRWREPILAALDADATPEAEAEPESGPPPAEMEVSKTEETPEADTATEETPKGRRRG